MLRKGGMKTPYCEILLIGSLGWKLVMKRSCLEYYAPWNLLEGNEILV